MGLFDFLTKTSFTVTEDGRHLFFPYGIIGSGYVIPDADEYRKLQQTIKFYFLVTLPLMFLALRIRISLGLIAAIAFSGAYHYYIHDKCQQMQVTHEKLSLRDIAAKQSWLLLLLLELAAVGFIAAGVIIFITRPENWPSALAALLFFGPIAVFAGILISFKRNHTG